LSLLGPNIPLSTLFSYTFCLCSFLRKRDLVSRPYKTIDGIIFLHILILESKLEDKKILHGMIASTPSLKPAPDFFANAVLIL
jgi:hypothetical protein